MAEATDLALDILLIEDCDDSARLTEFAFRGSGQNVNIHHVHTAREAISYLFQKGNFKNAPRPDGVLMDLGLPDGNGISLLEGIRAEQSLKEIPVIVLSANSDDEKVKQAYSLHANSYFVKPESPTELVSLSKTVLSLCSPETLEASCSN